jgi:hypothetical protein
MHKQWQELIPFYAAGTLAEAQVVSLNRHLAGCDVCSRVLDEWRVIGEAVRDEGSAWAEEVPPLSERARAEIQIPRQGASTWVNGHRPDAPVQTAPRQPFSSAANRRYAPVTLAAAVIAVVVFGGLLLYALMGIERPPTATILPASQTPETGTPAPTTTSRPTQNPNLDLGILTAPPGLQESVERTPQPPVSVFVPSPTSSFTRCMAVTASGEPVAVYAWPDDYTAQNGTIHPDEEWWTWIHSGDGWYQVYYAGITGWVPANLVTLLGPCDDLMLPSPTPSPGPSPTAIPVEVVSFHAEPATIERGGTITLTWEVNHAAQIGITRLSERGDIYLVPIAEHLGPSGSVTYTVPSDYIERIPFALVMNGADGSYVTERVEVEITCPFARSLYNQCPTSQSTVRMIYQPFERGMMIWRIDDRLMYVLYDENNAYELHTNVQDMGDSVDHDKTPQGFIHPVRGFGSVWMEWPSVRSRLGWATAEETAYNATAEWHQHWMGSNQTHIQVFTLPDGRAVRLISDWQIVNGN